MPLESSETASLLRRADEHFAAEEWARGFSILDEALGRVTSTKKKSAAVLAKEKAARAKAKGAAEGRAGVRFGGGEGADALTMAVSERDEQLMLAGRAAVGLTVGMPKRQTGKTAGPKDDLDNLLDQLDALDL